MKGNKKVDQNNELAIVIDDDQVYLKLAKSILEDVGFIVEATSNAGMAREFNYVNNSRGAALIVMDNRHDITGSYWRELIIPLRQKHPDAIILLVSGLLNNELQHDVKKVGADCKVLLKSDPFIHFLPKGEGIAYGSHGKYLKNYARQLLLKISNRRELQALMLKCAQESVTNILNSKLEELIVEVDNDEKPGTYKLDVIAEKCIENTFVPEIHFKKIVICTEEAGVHNTLYNRIQNPDFFIFSDPFDGSTIFKQFAEELISEHQSNKHLKLYEIGSDFLLKNWKPKYGDYSLNSPMVSIVLSERHKVVGAVLINLFTRDVFLSIDQANYHYRMEFTEGTDFITENIYLAIKNGKTLETCNKLENGNGVWNEMKSEQMKSFSILKEEKKLFLCNLPKEERSLRLKHAKNFIKPLFNDEIWKKSHAYRINQHNFTPGPGRILFIIHNDSKKEYEKESLDGNVYKNILSAGEVLTEWIGWFAFLRHEEHLEAYCLRDTTGTKDLAPDKYKSDDPSTMLPPELNSMFRDGYIDIGILHSAYGRKMRQYRDTILVCHKNDRHLIDKTEFLAIPLFQRRKL